MIGPALIQNLFALGGLLALWSLETWLPFAAGRHHRIRHAARNLSLAALSAALLALVAAPAAAVVAAWSETGGLGLLRLLPAPAAVSTVLAILLLDGWMYLWHRANHELRFLWRFHRVHHSDPEMDVTTAMRFHAGELLISAALRLALIPLLGISLWQLLLYDALLLPVIQFHHSNIRFPERFDRVMRLLITTPAMHRIHHSRAQIETDSNYGTIFSFWDRLGRTFRMRRDIENVRLGLNGTDDDAHQRLSGLLRMPFVHGAGRSTARESLDTESNPSLQSEH
jgi:sterol desaturase/sphingolipid hydroxylase (fatty acid hydroxylase superfamily)